ncbi:Atg28p-like protein [Hirsutella rhossiliensis]|uniref:Atg28p-like protein n=1 Tax=Hirsutella rhossiliensis TaxID=111463 RepID=A0A9P8SJG9_9HYPO|nr:Atg28p-like protein [Hirsutella rhossiliensis]KAH0964891.1 Atg28p-like protein [Hirsutella rhossiliensis]
MGLQEVRNGLRESLADLADLKREEDAQAKAALSERKTALARLDGLCTKRIEICDELKVLENDDEEPLGQELRKLGSEHDSLNDEIRQLEEMLAGMQNRRRRLKERMNDVKSKREAGLSGYRGALKDVDAEVNTLLRRPPVHPLGPEMLDRGKDEGEEARSTGGLDFMRLIPQRRTIEMARAWWEAEVEILEQQRAHIGEEQQALEQGSIVWQEVVALVTHFESRLREIMKAGTSKSTRSFLALDGKKVSRDDLIRSQLPIMDEVVAGLAQRMQVAESKRWNLLICAIGAEWETFKEAHDVLKGIVDGANGGVVGNAAGDRPGMSPAADEFGDDDPVNREEPGRGDVLAESDNEVPADLFVSRLDDAERVPVKSQLDYADVRGRRDSENDVPPEFLAEHDHGKDLPVAPP